MDLEQKKYPIGRFQKPVEFDEGKIKGWITVIKEFPEKVKELTQNMSDEQLDTPYRKWLDCTTGSAPLCRLTYKFLYKVQAGSYGRQTGYKTIYGKFVGRIRGHEASGYRFIIIHIGRPTSSLDGFVGKYDHRGLSQNICAS